MAESGRHVSGATVHGVKNGRRHGFTLVELLVVIAIIGILVGLLMPALSAVMAIARRMQCGSRMKNWGTAISSYESQNEVFPYAVIKGRDAQGYPESTGDATGNTRMQTFVIALWPYLELDPLYEKYDFTYNYCSTQNKGIVSQQMPIYFCPSDRNGLWRADDNLRSRGSYVLNFSNAVFTEDSYDQTGRSDFLSGPFAVNRLTMSAEMRDGGSNTMIMSEVIQAPADRLEDLRGDFFNANPVAAQYMTVNGPNQGLDTLTCVPTNPNDPKERAVRAPAR